MYGISQTLPRCLTWTTCVGGQRRTSNAAANLRSFPRNQLGSCVSVPLSLLLSLSLFRCVPRSSCSQCVYARTSSRLAKTIPRRWRLLRHFQCRLFIFAARGSTFFRYFCSLSVLLRLLVPLPLLFDLFLLLLLLLLLSN